MIDLTPYGEAIDGALLAGRPAVLATVGEDGFPDVGFKGSLMVLDRDHLAYWERTHGRHLANVRQHPQVAVLYSDLAAGKYVRFMGVAEVIESGPVREQIMARVIAPELERDPQRKGYGVKVRVDAISEPFGSGDAKRD